MKTCRKGLHQYEGKRCKECVKARLDPEKHKVKMKLWHKNNPADKEKINEASKKWREKNPERSRMHSLNRVISGSSRRRSRELRESLADTYVVSKLRMKIKDTTPELIEVKRLQLQIHRHLKEIAE